ncbi:2,3-bisphosphoglycerate-dependent phosphoglycerate mutase [Planococcus glaciei]|uniref:histidine phosphatase family protein n=1 Tax=Planococcus glaciei TaxID=459472 RepID=UPI00088DD8AF|nr:histidine phosphatase family protein [Planococcus glaciei]SDG68587.1 2,3-bisphosphoglycerate-dependent phosphoglycerate mutase [Planococcus glaciei]
MKKTIYLVRHCSATGQEPGALLTDAGEEQARQLAEFFQDKGITHIISSPFTRAIRSIEPVADNLGLGIEIEDRLAERVLSTANLPDWMERLKESFQDLDMKLSGGESGMEATERGMAALASAADRTILVTHGNLLGLMLKNIDESYGYEEWKNFSNPDIYQVEIEGTAFQANRIWEQQKN